MSAFFIASVKVKDPESFREYAMRAAETFATYGGVVTLRGKAEEVLAGEASHDATGIVRFPDMTSLRAWHDSEAYQALVPLREEAAEMSIVTYSVPA